MKFLANPFSTANLVRIASVLAAVVFMKMISLYYGFSWLSALAAAQ